MNDIEEASAFFNCILFADDSTFLNSMNTDLTIVHSNVINDELAKIHDWLAINRLSLNIKKTKFMIFHTINKRIFIPKIKIAGIDIERVHNFNFLGLTINENLSWKDHIEKIANKVSKIFGIINKLKHYLPLYILKQMYFCLIQSQFNYSILAWGYDLTRLTKLQKKMCA